MYISAKNIHLNIYHLKFTDYNFSDSLLESVQAMGFEDTTPVQEQAIPTIMEGNDLVACAQTGTGKTAAFLLPVIDKIIKNKERGFINTVIIVPTRELALQIDKQQLTGLAYFTGISSIPIYGGGDGAGWEREKIALNEGADIVVATPGKLLAHLNHGFGDFSKLKHLVLDEADRMLDMGFYDDIMTIINQLPTERQTLLFSATMPAKIRQLADRILTSPAEINIAISKPAKGVVQAAFMVYDKQKIPLVDYLLRDGDIPSVIIFSSRKKYVKEIAADLKKNGHSVSEMHSDLDQKEREEVIRQFQSKKINILVATDIIARGIDIESISMVINFDVPQDAEDYVHRVGRTARAASTGEAITFINEDEMRKFHDIEELIGDTVRKVALPAHLGESPEYNPQKGGMKKRRGGYYGKKKGNKKGRFYKKKD